VGKGEKKEGLPNFSPLTCVSVAAPTLLFFFLRKKKGKRGEKRLGAEIKF
jgi:hypothetical protein